MNFKRVMIILLAALLLPGIALAQTTSASLLVWKNFKDNNDEQPVEVTLNCFTGLPLTQKQTITDGKSDGVTFVVTDFKSGDLDCEVSEKDLDGYTADYSECGKNGNGEFNNITNGQKGECEITNRPDPVQIIVHKDWVIDGSGGDQLDPTYKLTLWCLDPDDGEKTCVKGSGGVVEADESDYQPGRCRIKLTGKHGTTSDDDLSYTALVIPNWDGGTDCWVDEDVYDSSVEVDNGCEDPRPVISDSASGDDEPTKYVFPLHVEIGDADDSNECTITNTVFYEGIPTLSQYGMAIMALLMLGVGFVGFRRFV